MFILVIFWLTTSNSPWFVGLTFQVPMQYCSLQHQTLLSPSDTSTTGCYFCFDLASSLFLEILVIALCSSQKHIGHLLIWGGSFSGLISFCLFILFMGFSPQAYWSGLPFPPLVDHILPELSTVTWPSWVALHGLAHSFTELHKPLCRDKVVIHEADTPGILLQFVFYSTLYLLRPIHINPCRENYFILFI